MRLFLPIMLVASFLFIGAACDSEAPPTRDTAFDASHIDSGVDTVSSKENTHHDAAIEPPMDAPPAYDAPPPACPPKTSSCLDERTQKACEKQGDGSWKWITTTCAQDEICLATACSKACADECNLGATRTVGGKTQTCALYSIAKKSFGPLSKNGLHDRARRHNAWIRAHHLPGGTIGDVYFKTAALKTPVAYHGIGDSAIWTGTYLAAEALRLKVTHSPDALANVEKLTEAIHRLFDVNGHPGYLSRYASRIDDPDPLIRAIYRPQEKRHHKVTYQGKPWHWEGNTSRDQYQGVMLGYSWAYEVLPPGKHRDLIRSDMVDICEELMKVRQVTVTVRFNLNGWKEIPLNLTLTNIIMNPTEFVKGHPYIQFGGSDNPSDIQASTMTGFREYWPDYHEVIKQIPLLGPLLNFPMPRSGSAIMIAAIFRIGIQVTEGVPQMAAENAKLKAYYKKNMPTWLNSIKAYMNLNGAGSCWKSYYGFNITWQPMWTLARLEPAGPIRNTIVDGVMASKMWPIIKDHKNVFFAYIYGSQQAPGPTIDAVVKAASAQLTQFQEAPKIRRKIDNTGKYPPNPHCPNQTTIATDVKDRSVSDFNWQRDPFTMVDPGDPRKVYPGIDYLLPYWMARNYGWTKDDSAGSCLRWK